MSDQCDHGHLRRVCEICQRDEEIAQLKAERDALKAAAEKGTEYVLAHINQDLKAERDALLAENRALRGLLKECRKVVKADTILRRSLPHIDLCKRINKAIAAARGEK